MIGWRNTLSRDVKGCIIGTFGSGEDITERKQMEQQLRQAQKMEAVGQLAGGVAHDFNNLLGVILGYAELLLQGLSPNDPQHKDIEQIQKAGDRAALLTRQLLAFSRKQVLQPRVLNLNAVAVGAEKLLQRLIGEDIELVVLLNPKLRCVKADPGQIEQIIMNLAVNARDAMPAGGKLTIETSNAEFDEQNAGQHAATGLRPHAMLAVTDTGCGMDEKTKAHIFEPFFTTKEFGKGTGLGLSTVYGIVKQNGGSVWVYTEPGIGTTFKIYLPCVDSVLEIESPSDEAESLMVTDVIMPGMSGRHLADRLTPLRPEMKVLYVSGYTDDAIVHHGVLEPGLAFLQKPFSPKALARKVNQVLRSGPLRAGSVIRAGSVTT
jgi:two-component system, cell cycle sensor histidine kinase and response regulator CckA